MQTRTLRLHVRSQHRDVLILAGLVIDPEVRVLRTRVPTLRRERILWKGVVQHIR